VNIGRNIFSISEYEQLVQLSIDYTLNVKILAESTEMFCVHEENIHLFAKTDKVTLLLSSIYLWKTAFFQLNYINKMHAPLDLEVKFWISLQ